MSAVAVEADRTLPGSQFPLGATVTEAGTNFAVASGVADGMVLCLFDEAGTETRIPIQDSDAGVWHVFVPGVGAGQAYGYRATGPYDPAQGARCHPAKLLLDPYACSAVTPGTKTCHTPASQSWIGIRVSVPAWSNRHSSMPSATPEATAKFVPVAVTVAPSGNWLPGSAR